ncbi:uncharacterized protein MAM_06876 [Metarhizium album ARSEF 1941]|uniref:Uncharacterized protein n=1 Tax=Metarhizium album (strain ARSEF 1941) TaxID=1081103 RepID=A0A0B2WPH3_METAS|nr:uncharacterized protein MAM_06876 [Metarhizium album ARSEF 1941]KHN95372.1 hypothetical protein MAM_06876 [Metarhizium album ARSEF 1941]
MPRFSVAFAKRKSAADVHENAPIAPQDAPSFRVIERSEIESGRSFDGGARMARTSRSFPVKTNLVDLGVEDNMFADLKINRGSNISNTTKGTSTDISSRHSNASTAPSSADMGSPNGHDDIRSTPQSAPHESLSRPGSKSIGAGLLDRATRTFSFGGQKKHSIPPPKQDPVPDLPPVLSISGDYPGASISRGMTSSTASTAVPSNNPGAEDGSEGALDLGGDFGSMFRSFDKRASTATLTMTNQDSAAPRSLTGNRYGTPCPLSPDNINPSEPLLNQRSPTLSDDGPTSPTPPQNDLPPPVPRHEHLNSFKYSSRPADIVEDEDAKLLRESFTAMKLLSVDPPKDKSQRSLSPSRQSEKLESLTPTTLESSHLNLEKEENMFEGSSSNITRTPHRHAPRSSNPPRNKVMTPAQFERYRQDKEGLGIAQESRSDVYAVVKVEDDDDEINYDDDEDEQEKSKQQTRQRRKQEAHMAVYRQQMMKVTGETNAAPLPTRQPIRPGIPSSSSAPVLGHLNALSPDPAATTGATSEEDDEDVPLAILQAHGFPSKNRPPTRLSMSGSNPNLRPSVVGPPAGGRAPSVMGDSASVSGRRHSNLPAFARNLPQDPFVGASIARPAIRESLTFGANPRQPSPQLPQQGGGPLPPGGLVGVIATEERSRALRRGTPSVDQNKLIGSAMNPGANTGYDPYTGIPSHMMYQGGGMQSMHQMPQQQILTPGDQAQIQMTQQMQQFMQMQMQFMQMMAGSPNGGPMMQQQPPMQPPYAGRIPGNQSMGDLSRHSMVADSTINPRQMDYGMRTMSMVQPSSASFMASHQQGTSPSPRGSGLHAYTPSIAPSERSNVGLPGRYRPVSQAAALSPLPGQHVRSNTMSGGLSLSNWSDDKSKSTVKLMGNSREGSDDDEEQGWEAMKAKRDKKRSIWRSKRNTANEFNMAF